MKSILMSFLMMVMIAGCVQLVPMEAEKPEDVPLVEQPEIIEKLDKKLTREKIKIVELNNGAYIEYYQTTYPHNQDQLFKDDWYENTFIDYRRVGAEEIIFVGFDDIKDLNQEIKLNYENCLKSITYKDDNEEMYLREFDIINYDVFENDDIISIIESKTHVLYEAGSMPFQYRIFNIDKNNGKLLENSELMINYDDMSDDIINTLIKLGYKDANGLPEINEEGIYFNSSKTLMNDEALIYKKDEHWMMIVKLSIYGAGLYYKKIMIGE